VHTRPTEGNGLPALSGSLQDNKHASQCPQCLGTTCSLELSLLPPAGIWFKTPLPVGGTNTLCRRQDLHQICLLHTTKFSGRECGGCQQFIFCGIPTKPAGGLPPDIGKVAPPLRWDGAPYRAALKEFYIPPATQNSPTGGL